MKSRMITDAPSAALEFDEEAWDAARIAQHDAKYTDVGRTIQVTAAQHIETGELVRFQRARRSARTAPRPRYQEDTLVLKEHRGHKLGTLVKCAGLLSWREIAPRVTPCAHLQRRGESPHARHQRGDRLRADRVRGRVEEGAR